MLPNDLIAKFNKDTVYPILRQNEIEEHMLMRALGKNMLGLKENKLPKRGQYGFQEILELC
jgi:hypothetical protein